MTDLTVIADVFVKNRYAVSTVVLAVGRSRASAQLLERLKRRKWSDCVDFYATGEPPAASGDAALRVRHTGQALIEIGQDLSYEAVLAAAPLWREVVLETGLAVLVVAADLDLGEPTWRDGLAEHARRGFVRGATVPVTVPDGWAAEDTFNFVISNPAASELTSPRDGRIVHKTLNFDDETIARKMGEMWTDALRHDPAYGAAGGFIVEAAELAAYGGWVLVWRSRHQM